MNRSSVPVVLAIVIVLCLALAFTVGRSRMAHNNHGGDRDVAAAIDRLTATQADMSERMDRLEYRLGTSPSARPSTAFGAGPGVAAAGNNQNGANLSPAARASLLADSVHALDDQLVRDPLSAQWAGANEKVIGDFLAKDNLARLQLPVPREYKSECHSHLCKISMVFPDEAQASQTQSMLLVEIAGALPQAQTVLLPRPDGSVEMVMFAGDAQAFRRP